MTTATDTPPDLLVLSPHLDDAALSCGGVIHALAAQGQAVAVVTVFTGDLPPGQPRTPLARRNERGWGLPAQPFAHRCEEDQAAVQVLGGQVRHLNLLDMIYRRTRTGEAAYRGDVVGVPPHPDDVRDFLPQLVAHLEALTGGPHHDTQTVLCPLGLGGHVDHVLVRRAAETVWSPKQLLYYEDYPYAERPDVLQAWQAGEGGDAVARWRPHTVPLDAAAGEARIAAVTCYRSQLIGLFPSGTDRWLEILEARTGLPVNRCRERRTSAAAARLRTGLRDYIARVGGERFWRRERDADDRLPDPLARLMPVQPISRRTAQA